MLKIQNWSFGIITKLNGAQSNQDGAKNIRCIFCNTSLTGCISYWAFANILGRAVLEQKKVNVAAWVPMSKKDDKWYVEFKMNQKFLNKEMMAKEQLPSCSQAKQSFLDSMKY